MAIPSFLQTPLARKRPFLVSSTRSPLASPSTPIHRLAAALQSKLYFPDPGPLYAVCGALTANTMRGYPVWLMLIGPPESGKTELLKPLLILDGVRECGDLSGKAGLLSGTKEKDKAHDATGGILKDMILGSDGRYRGMLVMLDFARTVLAQDPAAARATLGSIGMLHDQHWQRDIGTDGGRTLSFNGRLGFVAACTDVIDNPVHQQANAEMGERCLYFRYPESDGYHEINSALDNPDGDSKSEDIRELFLEWAVEMSLDWNDPEVPRPLTREEKSVVNALSQLCARGRSAVQRDRYNRNEVTGTGRAALGPRVANSLAQLLRGLERTGCTPSEIRNVLAKTAIDSLPSDRASALRLLIANTSMTLSEIADGIRVSATTAKRTLEDMLLHGLVQSKLTVTPPTWSLTERSRDLVRAGFGVE